MPSTISNLLVILGPTAVGKSGFAIELGEQLGGEIVSADSRYLYRGMDIGTAKPSLADRTRVPHHLIDVTDPDRPWSLAEYRDSAVRLITAIHARGRLPMLVGGTGQYIHALLEGWTIPSRDTNSALRAELEAQAAVAGGGALHARLRDLDPTAASAIDPRNTRRVIRALEVTLATGRPFSAQRQKEPPPFKSFLLGLTLPRPVLYKRIDARVAQMFAAGLVAETEALVARGYDWSLPAMSAIGYKQIGQYLRGEIDLAEAERLIKHETRRFVRRQANWFKATDPRIHWYNAEAINVSTVAESVRATFDLSRI